MLTYLPQPPSKVPEPDLISRLPVAIQEAKNSFSKSFSSPISQFAAVVEARRGGCTPDCAHAPNDMQGRKVDGGIPGHLYAVSDGGLVGFPPHVSVRIPIFVFQYKMGERRLTGGFLPQLSIRIRWGKPICQYYVVRKNALVQSRFVRQR